jgi:hypothetical protein
MRLLYAFLAFFITIHSFSQEKERTITLVPKAHFRTFWMSTSYPSDFKNDFALGSSLNLGGEMSYKDRLKIQLGYRFFGNLWSSDLSEVDPLSGQSNRYEIGLFDLLNPEDRFFGKIETLSVSYSQSKWGITAGRMGVDSDWINPQDGRLAPTAIEGINFWFESENQFKLEFWGIGKISVRGTSQWLTVGESIGVFPLGRDVFGKPAKYFQNTESKWISILELSKNWENFDAKVSMTSAQNISNTLWINGEHNLVKNPNWLFGVQFGFQHGWGDGGNPDPQLAYKNPEDWNYAISFRVGYANNRLKTNLNSTHLGGNGRWLSPREWGRDAWYTFIPRERNEGFSSLNAVTAYLEYGFPEIGLVPYLQVGLHLLPDIDLVEANKYNFPSYRQTNLGLKYRPKGLEKLSIDAVIMTKEALVKTDLNPNQRYNKVGMIHTNLILNCNLN